MSVWELVKIAVENINNNKLRSFLTTLGIMIGIAAVISVVAIGQGGRAMLMQEMEKFGTNLFVVYTNYQDSENWRPGDFQVSDIEVIKGAVKEIKYMAPTSYTQIKIRGNRGEVKTSLTGTTADYAVIRNLLLDKGRYISPDDDTGGRQVIVLSTNCARKLFGQENVVGQRVMIDNNSALVIGVLKDDKSMLGGGPGYEAHIPLTFMQRINPDNAVSEFFGSTTNKDEVKAAADKAVKLMERRHQAPGHYTALSMEQEMQAANKVTGIMSLIISCIAGISLLVGGIGVMNIMLVSVTERTREIGVRMALGASRRNILVQFIIEAVVLCLLGGLIGIILGYGGAFLIALIAKWPPLVSGWTILIAFAFSAGVGLFFGIYPANQAARMNPIDALRRD
jgi:putative ABC transport system permease protein